MEAGFVSGGSAWVAAAPAGLVAAVCRRSGRRTQLTAQYTVDLRRTRSVEDAGGRRVERVQRQEKQPQIAQQARSGKHWLRELREASAKNKDMVFLDVHKVMLHRELYEAAFERLKIRMNAVDPHRVRARPTFNIQDVIREVQDGQLTFTEEKQQTLKTKQDGKLRWPEVKKLKFSQTKQLPSRDAVVLEVMAEILASIFEPTFAPNSHGLRADGYNPHTCLLEVKKTVRRVSYFMTADIGRNVFTMSGTSTDRRARTMSTTIECGNLNYKILIDAVRKKIRDETFIDFLKAAIQAGHVKFASVPTSIVNVPQGTEISPILVNIYFDCMDKFMVEFGHNFRTHVSHREAFEEDDAIYFDPEDAADRIDEEHRQRSAVGPGLPRKVETLSMERKPARVTQSFAPIYEEEKEENDDNSIANSFLFGMDVEDQKQWSASDRLISEPENTSSLSSNLEVKTDAESLHDDAQPFETEEIHARTEGKGKTFLKPKVTNDSLNRLVMFSDEPTSLQESSESVFPGQKYVRGPPEVRYFRYFNNIFIAINASHSKANEIKSEIEEEFQRAVGVELRMNLIPSQRKVCFLGISMYTCVDPKTDRKYLKMEGDQNHLIRCLTAADFTDRTGEPTPRTKWYHHDKERIVALYSMTLNKLLGYYTFTSDFSTLSRRLTYILQHSCAKLLAGKLKLRSRAKVFKRWGADFGRDSIESFDLRKPSQREYGDFQDERFFRISNRWWL